MKTLRASWNARVAGADAGQAADITAGAPRLQFGWRRRLPVLCQTEAAECGLACLAMVAGFHGHAVELPALRQRFALSLKGATLARLIEMADALGLASRPLRLDLDELEQLATPCVLHWDLNHFVVLKRVRGGTVEIHDPAVGERKLPLAEVSKHFTGVALELMPSPRFVRKKPDPPLALRKLLGRIQGLPSALMQVMGLALVLELFALISPLFMQTVLDQVVAGGDRGLLTLLGVGFLLLTVLQVGVSTLRAWVLMWLGTTLNIAWAGNVFGHLLKLSEDYFAKRHLGDITSRFQATAVIQDTLTTRAVETILDGLMTVLTLGMMLLYSPVLAAVTLAAFALYAGLRALSYRLFREANLGSITAAARQQSQLLESIRGVQTIRLYHRAAQHTGRYLNAATDTANRNLEVQRYSLLFGSLNSLLFGLERIGVVWIGASTILDGQLSAGMLMAFLAYSDQFTRRGAALIDYLVDLRLLHLQGERLADIVLAAPERHVDTLFTGPQPEACLRLRGVGYRYAPGEPWILKNLDLDIHAGESVAIVGSSGCGKTTLAKILLGLLDPEEGNIAIGGIDLRRLGKGRYRGMLGAVMQDDTLFAGSIADNIAFFDPDATLTRIEAAARLASIHDDIIAMPMGYHSLMGDMGSSLSGGQRQRVLLARALYRRPRILVLDEATSHLDVAREHEVNAAIARLRITRIVIAHRPETIASAGRVIELRNSRFTEVAPQP
jgi:ATP-binding cassette subfamily B protein RaxB